jgi:hypothetical protein
MYNQYKNFRGPRGRFLFALFAPLLLLVMGGIVMLLWNAILPSLLAVNRIGYWQAIGLLLLCRILFGGLGFKGRGAGNVGGPAGGMHWRNKWQSMTDEEKANFKNEWRKRCEERKKTN